MPGPSSSPARKESPAQPRPRSSRNESQPSYKPRRLPRIGIHDGIQRLDARATRIRAGRPQTNGAVEALHKTILDECWRPSFARYLQPHFRGLQRDLADYLRYYNHERTHTGRLTRGRIPAGIVYGARKMETR